MFIMDEIRENTAGAIMTPEFVRLRAGTRTGEAIRAVRASGLDSDALYTLFITDQDGRLLGTLEMRTLLAAPGDEPVEALMDTSFTAVAMDADQQEAARLVRKYDLISLPVTDREGRLVGAIGVNSIVDVIEEEDTEGLRAHGRAGAQRGRLRGLQRLGSGLAPSAVAADSHGLGGIVRQTHSAL